MKIIKEERQAFNSIETPEQFMNILRSFKLHEATERITINSIEVWNQGMDIKIPNGESLLIEDRDWGTVILGSAHVEDEVSFPLQGVIIETRTTMEF